MPIEADDDGNAQVTYRIPRPLKDQLDTAARERRVAPSVLVEMALSAFLDDLIPIGELQLTRSGTPAAEQAPPRGSVHRVPDGSGDD